MQISAKIFNIVVISLSIAAAVVVGIITLRPPLLFPDKATTPKSDIQLSATDKPTELSSYLVQSLQLKLPDVEEDISYRETLANSAKDTKTLVINPGCKPDPLVLRIAKGQTLTIKNEDVFSHTLFIALEKFEIPAKSSLTATAGFGSSSEYNGYVCKEVNETVGYIILASR